MKKNFVPYEVVERFYLCLCNYKDFLDGLPAASNNTFDSFVKMRKCETCDTIFDMFTDIVFDNPDHPSYTVDYVFSPYEPDEFLKDYNLLYSSKIVKPHINSEDMEV